MNKFLSRAASALLCTMLMTGCHARWFPLSSAPAYHFRTQSADGTLNHKMEGTVTDEDAGYANGFRYEVPANGTLLIIAKPANPSVQLDINVYADGSVPVATTNGQSDKKLTVQDVTAGTIYVVVTEDWKSAQNSRFALNTVFKPADPDQANGRYKAQEGARDLPADKGLVSDTVDYSAMRRTNFWKISLPGDGGLTVKFNPNGANITAQLIQPQGAPMPIDPAVGVNLPDVAAGDYFVKVTATDAGDFGKYDLSTAFKAGDTCKNGGDACGIAGAEELKLPTDSKTSDVDFTKAKQFHYYKATLTAKGKLTIAFKILNPPRGSKVGAYLMKAPDDDGERISPSSSKTVELDPGDYYVRVQAPEAGDFAKYAVSSIFQPDNFISGDVVEIQRSPCLLTVSAGSNQGVRSGAGCTVVSAAGGAPLDSCSITEVYPNLSKVKPLAPGCHIPPTSKVQVAAQ